MLPFPSKTIKSSVYTLKFVLISFLHFYNLEAVNLFEFTFFQNLVGKPILAELKKDPDGMQNTCFKGMEEEKKSWEWAEKVPHLAQERDFARIATLIFIAAFCENGLLDEQKAILSDLVKNSTGITDEDSYKITNMPRRLTQALVAEANLSTILILYPELEGLRTDLTDTDKLLPLSLETLQELVAQHAAKIPKGTQQKLQNAVAAFCCGDAAIKQALTNHSDAIQQTDNLQVTMKASLLDRTFEKIMADKPSLKKLEDLLSSLIIPQVNLCETKPFSENTQK